MPDSMILDIVYFQSIRKEEGFLPMLSIQIIGLLSIFLYQIKCTLLLLSLTFDLICFTFYY